MRSAQAFAQLRMVATALCVLPAALLAMPFLRGVPTRSADFYGMGVSLDKGEAQFDLLDELALKHVLVRVPLFEPDRLDAYVGFVRRLHAAGKTVLINVLQDREHIESLDLFEADLRRLFESLSPYAREFQVGNAINRTKWGFFSVDEYLRFYQVAHALRERAFPDIRLLGPAVIDFEYHHTARALFNARRLRFDRATSLLYVDRRGAPEHAQMGIFDTRRKIDLMYALAKMSPKVRVPAFYVTEVNWPLRGTAPYAPTSEQECVSLEEYARFMYTYHDIAATSGKVARVYWHQLIAPGYGLVDDRGGECRKYPAFDVYREMLRQSTDS